MKKLSLFLFALALVAVALVNRPAEAAACVKPTFCSPAPACCNASECVSWCRSIGGGEAVCLKPTSQGGCCACRPLEG